MSELQRSWPVLVMMLAVWVGVIVLRTPALGIDSARIISVALTSGSMLTLGIHLERIRQARDKEKRP